jgi:hypothetical protein
MDCSSRGPSRSRLNRGGVRLGTSILVLINFGCGDALRIDLPDPTGDRESDRAALTTAFEQVPPGGTISFGTGTYVIGGESLTLTTPGVSLLGHPDGTTLLGCTGEELEGVTPRDFQANCRGIRLGAEAQRVSGLRFESFSMSLQIEQVIGSDRTPPFTGGQIVEGNSFSNSAFFEITVDADSTVLIRGNEFRNMWHAFAILGRNVHVLDNDISVPEPTLVPMGYPGGALGIAPGPAGTCGSMLVEGNRIDGHSEAVMIGTLPIVAGASCSDITVRNNEITMRPIHVPADPTVSNLPDPELAGTLVLAPAIRVTNAQRILLEGVPVRWQAGAPEGGWPPAFAESRITGIVVEENRITGAVGIGIEFIGVDDSRIIGNVIEVRPATTPQEMAGLEFGGNMGRGIWVVLGLTEELNGSPIWVSPDSEGVLVED